MPTHQKTKLSFDTDTTRAISSGEVDALMVPSATGDQLFTLKSNDQIYRKLIEQMSEGALTVSGEGIVLFANQSFANMLKTPLEHVIGSSIFNWVATDQNGLLQSLLKLEGEVARRAELRLKTGDEQEIPVYLSATLMRDNETPDFFCLVITDLIEQKRLATIVASEKLARELLAASEQSSLTLMQLLTEQQKAKNQIEEQLLQLKDNL